jgi:hypothetical protein
MLIEWWWCVGVLIQWIRENKASEMRAISHWSWPATTTTGESLRLVLARICSVGDVVLYYTYPWPVSRLDWPLAFRRTVFDIISKRRKTMQHPWHFKLKHTHRSHGMQHICCCWETIEMDTIRTSSTCMQCSTSSRSVHFFFANTLCMYFIKWVAEITKHQCHTSEMPALGDAEQEGVDLSMVRYTGTSIYSISIYLRPNACLARWEYSYSEPEWWWYVIIAEKRIDHSYIDGDVHASDLSGSNHARANLYHI